MANESTCTYQSIAAQGGQPSSIAATGAIPMTSCQNICDIDDLSISHSTDTMELTLAQSSPFRVVQAISGHSPLPLPLINISDVWTSVVGIRKPVLFYIQKGQRQRGCPALPDTAYAVRLASRLIAPGPLAARNRKMKQ